MAILLGIYVLLCAGGMFYAGYTHVSVSDATAGFGQAFFFFFLLLQTQSVGFWEFVSTCVIFGVIGVIFFGLGTGVGWLVGKLVGL